jgi:23S rRNA (uracil1939-C5)-methyltransferase
MPRLSPLQRKLKLKNPSASAKQKRAQAQVDVSVVTLPMGKHIEIELQNLSHDGRGVGRWQGKTVFVNGALQGETVSAEVTADHKTHAEAQVLEIHQASADRIDPICPVYDTCGGCQLQHLQPAAQVTFKQAAIAEQLRRIGSIEVPEWVAPITKASQGYRRRAQLATRYFADSRTLLMGFRQSGHKHIVPIDQCPVLEPALSALLTPLHDALVNLSQTQWVTHIELLQAQDLVCVSLKVSSALSSDDQQLMAAFAAQHNVSLVCQQTDVDDLWLHGTPQDLVYTLPVEADAKPLTMDFSVKDFVQVNAQVNQALVTQALDWLQLDAEDQVLDLFCGVGNFSLPIANAAPSGAQVLAVEGDYAMVKQGRSNAQNNGLGNVDFIQADLFEASARKKWQKKAINKVLLDPPRAGAKGIAQLLKGQPLERVVYVSCNPASMARDLKDLQSLGLTVAKVGCVDMFPHTTHLEVMALLIKE